MWVPRYVDYDSFSLPDPHSPNRSVACVSLFCMREGDPGLTVVLIKAHFTTIRDQLHRPCRTSTPAPPHSVRPPTPSVHMQPFELTAPAPSKNGEAVCSTTSPAIPNDERKTVGQSRLGPTSLKLQHKHRVRSYHSITSANSTHRPDSLKQALLTGFKRHLIRRNEMPSSAWPSGTAAPRFSSPSVTQKLRSMSAG